MILFVLAMMKLVIVYDNNPGEKGFVPAWGFSVYIEYSGKKILFDTGGDGKVLLHNLHEAGIPIDSIRYIFLSHIHGDHTSGLWEVLNKNQNVTVFVPKSFPGDFKSKIKEKTKCVEVSKSQEILPRVWSTGELGTWIKEQALVFDTDSGLVIITGCAHPGIVNIVCKSKNLLNKNVFLVLGGFHLIGASRNEIIHIVNELQSAGVKKCAPCHCSGDEARKIFSEIFGDNFIRIHVGSVIQF